MKPRLADSVVMRLKHLAQDFAPSVPMAELDMQSAQLDAKLAEPAAIAPDAAGQIAPAVVAKGLKLPT